jgi:hypothetical protein
MQGPLLKQEVSMPVVTMPGEWATHCCGCFAPAPETTADDGEDATSTAGCRCLMCPGWYACLACADKEAAAHREAHPQGLHLTYSVTAEDEEVALRNKAAPPIPEREFVIQSLIVPFSKMFIPTVAVLFQASVAMMCQLSI